MSDGRYTIDSSVALDVWEWLAESVRLQMAFQYSSDAKS